MGDPHRNGVFTARAQTTGALLASRLAGRRALTPTP